VRFMKGVRQPILESDPFLSRNDTTVIGFTHTPTSEARRTLTSAAPANGPKYCCLEYSRSFFVG
jgi:hypothetical protein